MQITAANSDFKTVLQATTTGRYVTIATAKNVIALTITN